MTAPQQSASESLKRLGAPRSQWRLALQLLLAVALLSGGVVALVRLARGADGLPGEPAARLLPDVTLKTLSGGQINLAAHMGRPLVLNFWASWCPPCTEEMPVLEAFARQEAGDGVVVLAVNYGEDREAVEAFVREHALTLTVVMDSDGELASALDVGYLPTTLFVDRDGIVRSVWRGELGRAELQRAARALR